MRDLIVGTAGHIDHGKTALVRALTGIDADRLIEEKRRGITIDIGFAHLSADGYRIGFIDVPGHERFVKNMLAGIGGIHLVLFVVAADESVMPQTVEHFQICRLLGIRRGIVVLTKSGLVDSELRDVVRQEVAELVEGSFLEQAPVVAVDSLTGDGIPELKETLLDEIRKLDGENQARRVEERVFRLPIDRVFTVRGFGTIATGTSGSGSIRQGESVRILPGSLRSKVRNIEIFGESADRADAGQRTALNLPSVGISELRRGLVVCQEETLEARSTANVRLELLAESPGPLRHRRPVRLHHGSAEIIARVYLFGRSELKPGEGAFAQLRLEEPTVLLPGDRFIVRRYSPLVTIGGGMILDNDPPRLRGRRMAPVLDQYESLLPRLREDGAEGYRLLLLQQIRRQGLRGAGIRGLTAATGLKPAVIRDLIQGMGEIGLIAQDPPFAVDLSAIGEAVEQLREALAQFHSQHPLAHGMPREELRERYLGDAPAPVVQFCLEQLQRRGIIEIRGSQIALAGSIVALTPEQDRVKSSLLRCLRERPFQMPGPAELADRIDESPELVRNLFHFLVNSGEVVRISEDVTVLPEQLEELVARMRREFSGDRVFTVPEFKELLGLSRKFAIPVLEYLDRLRVTRRSGTGRKLVQTSFDTPSKEDV